MLEQPYPLLVVVAAAVVALIAHWLIAAIINRPKSSEHDLRRHALAIVEIQGDVLPGEPDELADARYLVR